MTQMFDESLISTLLVNTIYWMRNEIQVSFRNLVAKILIIHNFVSYLLTFGNLLFLFEFSNISLSRQLNLLISKVARLWICQEILPLPTPLGMFPTLSCSACTHSCAHKLWKKYQKLRLGTAFSSSDCISGRHDCFWLLEFTISLPLLVDLPVWVLSNPFRLKLSGLVKTVI